MDPALKRELLVTGVPAVLVPLVRAGVNYHYDSKLLDKQADMAVRVAERRADGLRAMSGGRPTVRGVQPSSFENPGDVYDELSNLRRETDCSFCHNAIDSLMDAPPADARVGYDELRSYIREVDRIEDRDISQAEAEMIVTDLVEQWTIVPQYVAGTA